MPKVIWASFVQLFDDFGDELNGGKIESYAGGTATPKSTYTDSTGGATNTNPIVLSAAGRDTGGIWLTVGESYKFILKRSNDTVLDTIDNVVVGEAASASSDDYLVTLTFIGTPGAQGDMGGVPFDRSVLFPVNFAGAKGKTKTNPASDFVISVQKNDIEVGAITIATTGVFTFATTGGATVTFSDGDDIDFVGPATVGSAAGIRALLVGTVV